MIPKLIYIILKFGFLAALGIGKLSSLKVENALGLRGVDCEDTIDGDTIDGDTIDAHNQGPPMRVLSGVEDPIRSEWTSSLVCKISKLHCSGLRFV